jgi:periplasmic divalent cation tolerance protein
MTNAVTGVVSCASPAEARKIGRALLAAKLVACVNILPGVESHYWWQGRVERATEALLVLKTTRAKVAAVTRTVKAQHSYETPEIIFLPVVQGERTYLKWVRASVASLLFLLAGAPNLRADTVNDWIGMLGSTNDEVRAEAADRLAQCGGERVRAQFRKMTSAGGDEQRQMGVVGLLQVSDAAEDVERVRARLRDEDATVRWSAALALGRSGHVEALPWLREVAEKDAAESVREVAGEAVAQLQAGITWLYALPEGLRQARALGKPLLVYVFVRGSTHCRQFEEGVLADREVVNAGQEFVCVRLDGTVAEADVKRYDVRGAPTVLLLNAEGHEVSRVAGVAERAAFLARLAEVRRGKLSFQEASRAAGQDPKNVPANWQVAQVHLEEGREDLAEPYLRNVVAGDDENRYGYTDDALFALGFAYGKQGRHANAVATLEKLLERWPAYRDKDKALYCLALSRLASGRKDAARATLEGLIRDFPNSAVVENAKQVLTKLEKK